jgi:hypothetical protein
MEIQGDILTVHGFMIDCIVESLPSNNNTGIKGLVKDLLHNITLHDTSKLVRVAKTLTEHLENNVLYNWEDMEEGCLSMISQWMLNDLGLTSVIIKENPLLKDLARDWPALAHEFPIYVKGPGHVQDLISMDPKLKWMWGHIATSPEVLVEDIERYRWWMDYTLGDPNDEWTRSLFRSSDGFFGISSQCATSTVQEGDLIAYIDNSNTPIILHPVGGGLYIVMGNAYIGNGSNLLPRKQSESAATDAYTDLLTILNIRRKRRLL